MNEHGSVPCPTVSAVSSRCGEPKRGIHAHLPVLLSALANRTPDSVQELAAGTRAHSKQIRA